MTNRANKQRDYNPRTIPDEQVCAQSFLQETVLGFISEKGYALKDEVLDGAKSQMEYKLEFETISPFEPLSLWDKRESIRQQKYLNALQRIAEQLSQALTEIGCEYRQASKAEKERFGFPPGWRGWIIVPREGAELPERPPVVILTKSIRLGPAT